MVKNGKLTKNFDLKSNYFLIAFLIEKRVYIAIDQVIIDAFKEINKEYTLITDEQFEEYLWHNPHHQDHFHIGIQCYDYQRKCRNEWRKWGEIGAKKKRWKKEFFIERKN